MAKRRPSGDGMVRKREDGRWEGRIVVGHKENGDSLFQYIYADTQKELTAKLRQKTETYQGVDLTEQSRMTLGEWMDQWLESMVSMVRPTTLARCESAIRSHIKPFLGEKPVSQITEKMCKISVNIYPIRETGTQEKGLPAEASAVSYPRSIRRWRRHNRPI